MDRSDEPYRDLTPARIDALAAGSLLALSLSSLRALGRYSYAMYIIHWPLIVTLRANDTIVNSVPRLGGSLIAGRVVFAAIAFVASFALAWLSWHTFEKHVLKLKDHFPYGNENPRGPASFATGQHATDIDGDPKPSAIH